MNIAAIKKRREEKRKILTFWRYVYHQNFFLDTIFFLHHFLILKFLVTDFLASLFFYAGHEFFLASGLLDIGSFSITVCDSFAACVVSDITFLREQLFLSLTSRNLSS